MTLGDSQPLSRRQARERARGRGEEVVPVNDATPDLNVPVLVPAALRPAPFAASAATSSSRRSNHHHAAGASEATTGSTGPSGQGESAAPVAANSSAATVSGDSTPAPHELSRRELRALYARQEQADTAVVDSAPVEEPVVAELIETVAVEDVQADPPEADPTEAELRADVTPSAKNVWTPPIGHWSVDAVGEPAGVQRPDQSLDELINRGIGAGGIPTTTNALILPSVPHQGQTVSPISNTGEIMITGSFDLPRSLGSTGAHPNMFDSSEMDHHVDQLDADQLGVDQLGGDSAPVSASRAVSTHASTRGMLTPPKKQHASLPMVLVITTAVLAVSVLGLLAGYLLGIF
ncbi:hypothetical protein [Cryobacterium sp. PH29-G1]|uniref:hypothetical protein n=1 Tax=Cryobacterium sp. PH29-G1 TaxID=3046211 RepID=UPI0024B9FAD0|nr:hypothetical protein [Cryobacterium sp. PH29-G1]MDJ0350485.1 hypothetical protein [Cryobacterium sp. PH29-G1]